MPYDACGRELSINAVNAKVAPEGEAASDGRSLIFDIPIALARPAEMLIRVTSWVGAGGPARRVMYVNAHVLNRSQESAQLRRALERADLVYCDGYGVRLAAKALDVEIPHRMTGADWIWSLASLCEAGGHSIYLLGCDPGIAAEAARRLRRQYPRLEVSGSHHGYFETGSPHDEHLQTELARWMLAHGYDKEGEKWARKVLGEHPGNPETCLLLADYHERLGQWDLAQYYRAQIRRNPSFPVPRQP